jgi:hypothetical protein
LIINTYIRTLTSLANKLLKKVFFSTKLVIELVGGLVGMLGGWLVFDWLIFDWLVCCFVGG